MTDKETVTDKLFILLQINDAAFPIGAYTHSYGLETYIQERFVTDAASAATYVEHNLRSVFLYSELLAVKLAYEAARRRDLAELLYLEDLIFVSKTARELRQASQKLGMRFVKTAGPLLPLDVVDCPPGVANPPLDVADRPPGVADPPLDVVDRPPDATDPSPDAVGASIFSEYSDAHEKTRASHAVAYGVFTAAAGISREDALAAFIYAQTAAMVTCCVKTIPLSQTDGQRILTGARSYFREILEKVNTLGRDDLCRSAPGLDVRAMRHENLYSRLYMS